MCPTQPGGCSGCDSSGFFLTKKCEEIGKREYEKVFSYKAGVNDGEDPPVPIPNTEVKLTCAEDSWLETTCENR